MADTSESVVKLEKTLLKIEAARKSELDKVQKEEKAHRVELEKLAAERNELGQFQSKEQRTTAQKELDQLDRISASNQEILKQTANTLKINTKQLEARTAQAQFISDQKESLSAMETSIVAQGGIATDNKEYMKLSLNIQQQELDMRRKTATTPAAKKAIKEEQRKLNAQQAGLLGKIAGGINSLRDSAKEKLKSAGKGIMSILKGTLIAGFLVALIAFFNSKYWEQTKDWLVNKGLPMLKNIFSTLSEGFGKLIDFFKEPTWDSFKNIFQSGPGSIVAAIAAVVAGLAVAKFLGPFKAGIGLLKTALGAVGGAAAKLIPGMGGGDKPSKTKTPKPSRGGRGGAGAKFGQVIGNIAKGLGKGVAAIMRGLATGLMAFANPAVLIGAGILAGSILVIGAGIAGASWLMGAAFKTLTGGLKSFEDLNGEKLKTVAIGIGAIGLALFALGAGGAMGGIGSMVGAITGSIGKFFGAKDPLTQLKKFSETEINAAQAKKNADAMVAYAKAMALAGGAAAVKGLGQFIGGITGSIGKFFGGKDAVDPLTQLKRFGATAVNAANIKANALAMKDYAAAMKDFPKTPVNLGDFINKGLGALAKAMGSTEGVASPFQALKKFGAKAVNAANIKTNAAAMKDYAAAMKDFPATPVKLGDFINGALGSLSSFLGITKKEQSPLQKVQAFGLLKVDSANIKTNAEAMTLYGNALKTLPAPTGGWDAVGTFVGGVFKSLGKLVGLDATKSPLQKLKAFGEFQIGAKALKRIPETANAMTLYGNAMAKVPKPTGGWAGIGEMVGGIAKSIGGWFTSKKESPLTQLKKFGEMVLNTVAVSANAKAFVEWSKAMSTGTPLLKKAFENFEIKSTSLKLLDRLIQMGSKGLGLEAAGRGIKSLAENMMKFVGTIGNYKARMGHQVDDLLSQINDRGYNKNAAAGLQATANLLDSISNMSLSMVGSGTPDFSKFKFPVPDKVHVESMRSYNTNLKSTLRAMKKLGIEGPKTFKAFEGKDIAIPVRVVGDVRIAEMRQMKLDAAGNQVATGMSMVSAPVSANSINNSKISVGGGDSIVDKTLENVVQNK